MSPVALAITRNAITKIGTVSHSVRGCNSISGSAVHDAVRQALRKQNRVRCVIAPRGSRATKAISTNISAMAFEAISAVEGLKLSRAGRERVSSKEPLEKRRAEVIRAYSRPKGK